MKDVPHRGRVRPPGSGGMCGSIRAHQASVTSLGPVAPSHPASTTRSPQMFPFQDTLSYGRYQLESADLRKK